MREFTSYVLYFPIRRNRWSFHPAWGQECSITEQLFHSRLLDIMRWCYNYVTSNKPEWNNGFIKYFKFQTFVYYNWILVNFILNMTKRPDINVTSVKPREHHMTCAPFANLVEWKIWGKDAVLKLFSTSTVFAFSRCDCGIWRWIGQPDYCSISFSSST